MIALLKKFNDSTGGHGLVERGCTLEHAEAWAAKRGFTRA
jgi:hypothetical protein